MERKIGNIHYARVFGVAADACVQRIVSLPVAIYQYNYSENTLY